MDIIDRGPGLRAPDTEKKTVYLASWDDEQFHGPGRKFSLLRQPPHAIRGDGVVETFVPDDTLYQAFLRGSASLAQFRRLYLAALTPVPIHHGRLKATLHGGETVLVDEGDTLLCKCSAERASDLLCHRAWLAQLLLRASWRVLIDGRQQQR